MSAKTCKVKPELPSENSVSMRVVSCILSLIAICAGFVFGKSPVPQIDLCSAQAPTALICVWLCMGGCMLSYHLRARTPKVLKTVVKQGGVLIILNLLRELIESNLRAQQFQFMGPLVDAMVATNLLACFEQRTRHDILSSAALGMCLMALSACSGRSLLFGGLVVLYVVAGTLLLFLAAISQTRDLPHCDPLLNKVGSSGWQRPPLALTACLLPLLSLSLFCFLPRLDSQADWLSTQVRALVTGFLYRAREEMHPKLKLQSPNALAPALRQRSAGKSGTATALPPPPESRGENGRHHTLKMAAAHFAALPASASRPHSPSSLPPATAHERPKAARPQKTGAAEKAAAPASKTASLSRSAPSRANTAENGSARRTASGAPAPAKQAQLEHEIMDAGKVSLVQKLSAGNRVLFTLSCNRRVYVKMCTLDYFDGQSFRRSDEDKIDAFCLRSNGTGIDLSHCPPLVESGALPVMELSETFCLKQDLGFEVPTGGDPQQLSLPGAVLVDTDGNVRSTSYLLHGTRYNAACHWPIYSLADMRKTPSYADSLSANQLSRYLELPDSQADKTVLLAQNITAGGANRFVQAEALVSYLRKTCRYDLQPLSGKQKDNLVDRFVLGTRRGDCKAFASSFVVLCRAVGIPARLVAGFLPGDFDPLTGSTTFKVKHGHAWAEIYMEPYGWISFDPTPGGALPARLEEQHFRYADVRKQIEANTQSFTGRLVDTFDRIVKSGNLVLWILAGLLTAFGLTALLAAAWNLFARWLSQRRKRHPAYASKRAVLRRLKRLGVVFEQADTGFDIVRKLEAALSHRQPAPGQDKLKADVEEFFKVYNAVCFGCRDELLPHVKELAATIAQYRRG